MPVAWPPSLPTSPLYGDSERGMDRVIYQETATGPGKLRNRYTTAPKELTITFILDDTECGTLFTFYDQTTGGGADTITGLPHPRTGGAVTMRFKPGTPPIANRFSFNKWRVVCTMEIIP